MGRIGCRPKHNLLWFCRQGCVMHKSTDRLGVNFCSSLSPCVTRTVVRSGVPDGEDGDAPQKQAPEMRLMAQV